MEMNTIVYGRGKKYWPDKTPYGPLKIPKKYPLKAPDLQKVNLPS